MPQKAKVKSEAMKKNVENAKGLSQNLFSYYTLAEESHSQS